MSKIIRNLLTRCQDEYQQRSRDLDFRRGLGGHSEGRMQLLRDMRRLRKAIAKLQRKQQATVGP